jgi:uncharacterized protein
MPSLVKKILLLPCVVTETDNVLSRPFTAPDLSSTIATGRTRTDRRSLMKHMHHSYHVKKEAQASLIMLQKELLEILACPQCKGPVTLHKELNGIVCPACRLVYEIRDEIPIMLIDEAKPLDDT